MLRLARLLVAMLVLAAHTTVLAESIESRRHYVIDGRPVSPSGIRGTVGVGLFPEGFVADDQPLAWQVAGIRTCTGVLIHPRIVLTAAHCVEDCERVQVSIRDEEPYDVEVCADDPLPAHRVYVVAGMLTDEDLWRAEVAQVEELIVPEEYVPTTRWWEDGIIGSGVASDINDIAVLRLESPVQVVAPVPILLDTDGLVSKPATATGYGLRGWQPDDPYFEGRLDQETYVSRLNETTAVIQEVTDDGILAETSGRTCFGDSGGPLYVQRRDGTYVAGVLSRFAADAVSACVSDSVYTSVPARADWILKNAPEATPFDLGGGGGCSASRADPDNVPGGAVLLGAILVFAFVRKRPALALGSLLFVGCGGETASSLCTPERDPLGWYCGASAGDSVDAKTAVELARAQVVDLDDAVLWSVFTTELTPDGESQFWHVTFHVPQTDKARTVVVSGEDVFRASYSLWDGDVCVATAPLRPLDSRRVAHDAIRRFEAELGTLSLASEHMLAYFQDHPCAVYGLQHMRNVVRLQLLEHEWAYHMAAYDDRGQFLGQIGPCFGALETCEW